MKPHIDHLSLSPLEDRRVILIVLDGVGCGALPDAAVYGDDGSNSLGNLSRFFDDGLELPNLGSLGLGNIVPIRGVPQRSNSDCRASFGRCVEVSPGKDSTTGHWEMAGVILPRAFPTYPEGFPDEVINAFARAIGRGVLGNKAASGTEIIKELGAEHLRTGCPIVYTSVDSVFQIAAHESVYSAPELYDLCRTAREILSGPHAVGRVIARPFRGIPGSFERTSGRHDFSIEPLGITILDRLMESGVQTIGIGKIGDLFAHRGLNREVPTSGNAEGIERLIESMKETAPPALIFLNLVEFDQVYGHRNDCSGYRRALEAFDSALPSIMEQQRPGDVMIITSDHGVDPTTPSTDHSREHSPLLVWGNGICGGIDLRTRSTFADIGQTVAEYLGVQPLNAGTSFLPRLTSVAAVGS